MDPAGLSPDRHFKCHNLFMRLHNLLQLELSSTDAAITIIGMSLRHRQPQATARYALLARHSVKSIAEQIADCPVADVNASFGDSDMFGSMA